MCFLMRIYELNFLMFLVQYNRQRKLYLFIWKIIVKMKVFAGLVATTLAAPAPAIIGGKNAVDGQFPHQVQYNNTAV